MQKWVCVRVCDTFFEACERCQCFVKRVGEGGHAGLRAQASSVVLYQGFQSPEVPPSASRLPLMAQMTKRMRGLLVCVCVCANIFSPEETSHQWRKQV